MNYLQRNALPIVVGLFAIGGIAISTTAVVNHYRNDTRAVRSTSTLRLGGATLGVQIDNDLKVTAVTAGSPAQQAGVHEGDQITAVEGHTVKTPDDLRTQLDAVAPNSDYTLRVTRAGKSVDLKVHKGAVAVPFGQGTPATPRGTQPGVPGASPSPATPPSPRGGAPGARLGVLVEPATGGVRVNTVTPGSAAETAGVKANDLITGANGKATATVEALQSIVADAGTSGGTVALAITRDGQSITVTVRLAQRQITPTRPGA